MTNIQCPKNNFHDIKVRYHQEQIKPNIYICTCRCIYKWYDELHWQILVDELPICTTDKDFHCYMEHGTCISIEAKPVYNKDYSKYIKTDLKLKIDCGSYDGERIDLIELHKYLDDNREKFNRINSILEEINLL